MNVGSVLVPTVKREVKSIFLLSAVATISAKWGDNDNNGDSDVEVQMIDNENADNTRGKLKRNSNRWIAERPVSDVALVVKNVTVQIE